MDHDSSLHPLAFLQEISSFSHTNLVTHLLTNIFKILLGWNGEVDSQTIHLTENLTSMNLLQMSCLITWAQKKFSLQPKKKN